MEPCIEQRLVQLLRESAAPAVPLRDLHEALLAGSDRDTMSYVKLAEAVRRRREVFVLLEAAHPLGDAAGWPAATRSEYERALVEAGLDTGPRVSLIEPADPSSDPLEPSGDFADAAAAPLRELRESLIRVWRSAGGNNALRAAVAAALAGCADLPIALREADTVPRPASWRRRHAV